MQYRFVAHLLFWLITGIMLSACTRPPEVITAERVNLARIEDKLAECRLFVFEENFESESNTCDIFSKEDQHCAEFPEQKEGCQQFLYRSDYKTQKLQCKQLQHKKQSCETLVRTKIEPWYYEWLRSLNLHNEHHHWTAQVKRELPNIDIGIVRSGFSMGNFIKGVKLAVSEVNDSGGVFGRKFELHTKVTKGQLEKARQVAEEIKNNERIRVVLGRQPSRNVIPVINVYEKAKIVFLAISASNLNVIRGNMQFVFRQLPNNDVYAKSLAGYCKQKKYKNIALLYNRTTYNEEISYAFRDYIVKDNMRIVFEKSFFKNKNDFLEIAANLRKIKPKPDVIFSPISVKQSVNLIDDLRAMGVNLPIVATDSLNTTEFLDLVSEKESNLVIPTIYNLFSEKIENVKFVDTFRDKYGHPPDAWSAQGYDAIKLLAHVIDNESHSTVPANIAASLTHIEPFQGAGALYAYQDDGEIKNRPIYFKELKHKEYILLKNTQQEEELLYFDIIEDRIIYRPEKRGESTEAMSIF